MRKRRARAANAQLEAGADRIALSESEIESHLALAFAPEPDLLIRTGGEKRISNFLLYQLAYTEFYFCDVLWPQFDAVELDRAFAWFAEQAAPLRHDQRAAGRTRRDCRCGLVGQMRRSC